MIKKKAKEMQNEKDEWTEEDLDVYVYVLTNDVRMSNHTHDHQWYDNRS